MVDRQPAIPRSLVAAYDSSRAYLFSVETADVYLVYDYINVTTRESF